MKIFTFIALCILIMASCTQEKECPAFNEADKVLIPYDGNETLTFVNQYTDTLQIILSEMILNEAYTFSCKNMDGVCACTNYAEIPSADAPGAYFLRFEQSDASTVQYYKYDILEFEFEFDFINELPYIDDFDNMELANNIIVNNISYTNVVVAKNLSYTSSDLSKVYFNQLQGILKFEEKNSDKIWEIR